MIETFEDGSSITYDYSYDADKLIKIISSDGTLENYSYNGPNGYLSKIQMIKNGTPTQEETFEYNQLLNIDFYIKKSFISDNVITTTFSYDNFQTYDPLDEDFILAKSQIIANGEVNVYESELIMNGKNIAERVDKTLGNAYKTMIFQYDVKNAPTLNNYSINTLIIGRQNGGVNNIIGTNYIGGGTNESTNISYTYNADNFPITANETDKDGKKIKREYIY